MARRSRKKTERASRAEDRADRVPRPSPEHDHLGPDTPRPVEVTQVKPGEPRTSDEAGDVSLQNADRPGVVREETGNTSTSSGTHPGDEGDDQKRKDLLRRGARGVERMD